MKKLFGIAVCALSLHSIFAQSLWKDQLYDSLNHENFRTFKPFLDTIDIDKFDVRLINATVFFATNEIRAKKRLSVLQHQMNLETAAYFHSKNMAEKRFFDHYNNNDRKRKTPNDRATMAGVGNPFTAENIVEGFVINYKVNADVFRRGLGKFSYTAQGEIIKNRTYLELADALLDAWMNSPPHKKNILSKDNKQLGCGVEIYFDSKFNNMPMVKATQLFQMFYTVETKEAEDHF